jgi:hypothetical protein
MATGLGAFTVLDEPELNDRYAVVGEQPLPPATFPGRELLRALLPGDAGQPGRYRRLAGWLNEHPEPTTG